MIDKAESLRKQLARARSHNRTWPEPKAELILNLHFTVQSYTPHIFHAQIDLEIPVKGGLDYFCISAGARTPAAALRRVIEKMEESMWFHFMRSKGVRFKVTGCDMDYVYKGYL